MSFVACRGLGVDYDVPGGSLRAVEGIELAVEKGEFVAVLGRSGCGKTTLLRVLAGLLAPSRGEVERPAATDGRPGAAVVFQEGDLLPWRSALDNVAFGRIAFGEPVAVRRRRALEALARVGLGDQADYFPRQLSLGMQRRVSVARAFGSGAELLLLDEPFASLDAQTRWDLQQELDALCRAEPRTVLFVTHDIGEALWLADRVVVLGDRPARIVAERRVPFARPRSAELRWQSGFNELERELWSFVARPATATGAPS